MKHGHHIDYYNSRARDTSNYFDFPADFKKFPARLDKETTETTSLRDAAFGKETLQAEPASQRSEVCGRSFCHQRDE